MQSLPALEQNTIPGPGDQLMDILGPLFYLTHWTEKAEGYRILRSGNFKRWYLCCYIFIIALIVYSLWMLEKEPFIGLKRREAGIIFCVPCGRITGQ